MPSPPRPAVRAALLALSAVSLLGCAGASRRATVRAEPAQAVPARTAPATPAPASTPVSEPSPDGAVHVVRAGETLSSISRDYGVTLEALIRANGIADPDRIATGRLLHVPGRPGGALLRTDWVWPVAQGEMLSSFGAPRRSHRHTGIDIRGYSGQEVVAAGDGRVVYSGSGMRGYGKTVILDHGGGLRTLYAHNSALLVRVGQRVRRGEAIARVGRTGNATTEHCHFEIRQDDVAVDPLAYLGPWSGSGAGFEAAP